MLQRQLRQSAVRRHILQVLVERPQDRFSIPQLEHLTHHAHSAIHREVAQLEAEGIVLKTQEGNRLYYRINTAHKLHKEIKAHLAGWVEPDPAETKARGKGRPRASHIRGLEEERDRLKDELQRGRGELTAALERNREAEKRIKQQEKEAAAGSKREQSQARRIAALLEQEKKWTKYAEGLAKDGSKASEELLAAKRRLNSVEARLDVTRDAPARARSSSKPAPESGGMRTLNCVRCLKDFKVKVAWSGQTKQCPHCAHLFRVPDFGTSQ